ncbi:MAG: caspase domain-containing protein, partial [Thiohalomonadales bacterium]
MYYRSTFTHRDSVNRRLAKGHWYALFLLGIMFGPTDASYAQSRGIALEPAENIAKTPYLPGQFRALIIGNNKYNDTTGRWLPLNTAATDAASVEKLLRDKYGFSDITRLTNATRRETLLALSDLSQRVLPNDSVLVFYAGHGYIDAATNKGFWVPTDAEGTDHTTFLRNSTIRDEISIIADRSKHTLLIADSCFSGTLLRRGTSLPAPEAITEKYYNKVAKKKSVQIMTSGGIEFVDDNYRKSGHSPFTHFLLNELENNNSPMVTVSELSANVTKAVAN